MSKLFMRYSSMNVGKTSSLLQIAFNYREQGREVCLFTAEVDDRTEVGVIASRIGIQATARTFNSLTDFWSVLSTAIQAEELSCVLIDEAQFLSAAQVRDLHRAAHLLNIPIICFGIRTDFRGEPFEGSSYLLALADDIEEMKGICSCLKKSTMNIRIDEAGHRVIEGEQIDIGGNARYRQTCGRCFYLSAPSAVAGLAPAESNERTAPAVVVSTTSIAA